MRFPIDGTTTGGFGVYTSSPGGGVDVRPETGIDKLPLERIAVPPVATSKPKPRIGGKIVLYDATCGLCDSVVNEILDRDVHDRLQLAPLDGPLARRIRKAHGIADDVDSVFLVTGYGTPKEKVFAKAAAVSRIGATLGGMANVFAMLSMLPRGLADAAYDVLARNRHRLFPPPDACAMPTPQRRAKLID